MMKKLIILSFVILLLLLGGCRKDNENIVENPEDNNPSEEDIVEEPEEVDEIQKILDGMTIDEKIGQLFIFGLEGTTLDEHMINVIESNHIGGFILFKQNIVDVDQTLELLNSIKKTNASSGNMPLFFALDEEGGKVARLSDFYTDLPSASKIGDINDSEISTEYGRILGERLKNFGFNVDFAPVLDVNSNPKNPVIGVRAFGSDVDTVVNNGLKVMEGIDSTGVIPVVKHFPGHGDTGTDSHVDLPVINKTLEELESLELVPFKKAIENEAQALMVAHILFRELDSEYPATLSHDIITGLLRENLSYDGVVISDDMTMGAIMENYTVEEASVKFLKAGGDILLICHGYENQLNALNRVKEEVKSGNITEDELDEKVYRIIKLKMKYGLKDNIVENIDLESINLRTKNLLNKINQ